MEPVSEVCTLLTSCSDIEFWDVVVEVEGLGISQCSTLLDVFP